MQTVGATCDEPDPAKLDITVFGMEADHLGVRAPQRIVLSDPYDPLGAGAGATIHYVPLSCDTFKKFDQSTAERAGAAGQFDCVVGCASAQPCATAAQFSAESTIPCWIDLFGDPIAEIQTRACIHPGRTEENASEYHHVWKLLMQALVNGDSFSSLSARQRFSVIGQLGVAGRLNAATTGYEMVHTLPYGLFGGDLAMLSERTQASPAGDFHHVMWCGGFNSWMDVSSLVEGIRLAIASDSRIRILVVGGAIPGYNDVSYAQFLNQIEAAGIRDSITLLDWLPLNKIMELYGTCHVGVSIDRRNYESLLGSRTRIAHFLAAGLPVVSTGETELAGELSRAGVLFDFEPGDSQGLANALIAALQWRRRDPLSIKRCRRAISAGWEGKVAGQPLMEWLSNPAYAPDKVAGKVSDRLKNPLMDYWQRLPLNT